MASRASSESRCAGNKEQTPPAPAKHSRSPSNSSVEAHERSRSTISVTSGSNAAVEGVRLLARRYRRVRVVMFGCALLAAAGGAWIAGVGGAIPLYVTASATALGAWIYFSFVARRADEAATDPAEAIKYIEARTRAAQRAARWSRLLSPAAGGLLVACMIAYPPRGARPWVLIGGTLAFLLFVAGRAHLTLRRYSTGRALNGRGDNHEQP
jgi:hypothetical protein